MNTLNLAERLEGVFRRINDLNEREAAQHGGQHKWTMLSHFNHLVEEVGEMAKCNRGRNDATMMEEAVDASICALAVAIIEERGDMTPVLDMFDTKLDKWESSI
jgi:hypothetical protein